MRIDVYALLVILTIAAIFDLSYRRIPNILTLSTIVGGLIFQTYFNGLEGFFYSVFGLLLGIILLFFFYLFGVMGAGDVKLLGAVGSILGPAGVFNAFLFTAIVGGIYALIALAINGQLVDFIKRFMLSMKLSLMTGRLALEPNEGKASPILCYGIAIAIGTSLSLFFDIG